jgi:hypothetical protein
MPALVAELRTVPDNVQRSGSCAKPTLAWLIQKQENPTTATKLGPHRKSMANNLSNGLVRCKAKEQGER